jgi:hypothetical protein
MTDAALWTGLANIGMAALASIAIAFFEPQKHWRAALFTLVCVTALANFYIQRTATSSLNTQIDALQINRWDPLTDSEGERFSASLSKIAKPNKPVQVVCAFASCNDLAQSIRHWAAKGGWSVSVVGSIFGPPDAPLEFWYYDESELSFLNAIEDAARPRLKAVRKHFDDANSDQINLFVGYKS